MRVIVMRRPLVGMVVLLGVTLAMGACSPDEAVVPPPGPESTDDYGMVMARCLNEKGWNVSAVADGGFETDTVPAEQMEQFQADIAQCQSVHGYSNDYLYTPERAESFFDASLETAECLRELGYSISDPPSRQAFVEALVNDEPPPWYPHHEAMAAGGRLAELEAACPQPADTVAAG